MKKSMDRETLRKEVIRQIEENFADSIVLWSGTGLPDEEDDDTEQFEALWITDDDYERFLDFEWKLESELAKPNGFRIMVQCLSPEATKKYRWNEYQSGKLHKTTEFYLQTPVPDSYFLSFSIEKINLEFSYLSNYFKKQNDNRNEFWINTSVLYRLEFSDIWNTISLKDLNSIVEDENKTDIYSIAA